jgi:hypothetical protein
MTWRGFLVAALLLAGCALLAVGCDDSDSGLASPLEDWVTFEGEYVSLQLPGSFVGGDPSDPKAMAELNERAASHPDPGERGNLQSYLRALQDDISEREQYSIENLGPLLVVWGTPSADGSTPSVVVRRFPLDGGLLVETDGDVSMKALVDAEMFIWPEAEWTVASMTEDRAHVVVHHAAESPDDRTIKGHMVFRAAGDYMYEFDYTYQQESNPALDAAFAASTETATVRSPYDLPKISVDQTVYLQDGDCQSLVQTAGYAIEKAYAELGTCDPAVMTPEFLSQIEPSVSFVAEESAEAALLPAAETSRNEVAYYGEAGTYWVGSQSESGKAFGQTHIMERPGEYWMHVNGQPGRW